MNNPIDPFDELAAMFLTAPQPQPLGAARQPAAPMPMATPAAPPATHASPGTTTEMLIVGHLPVRAGLWLTPYADQLAREIGTVALVRVDGVEPTLQLLRAPESMAAEPLGMSLQQTIMHVAPCVDLWMLRGPESMPTDELVDVQADRITILSSADEAAVVSAYQTVKALAQAAEHSSRALPRVGLAIVGADMHTAEGVIDRLNRTSISFLGVEMRLVALLPRMDAGIKCTRYVTFGREAVPSVMEVRQWIEQAKAMFRAPQMRAEVAGRVQPPAETFVLDAARILRTDTTESALPPRSETPSPMFSKWKIPGGPQVPATPGPSPQPAPVASSSLSSAISPEERADLIGAIGPAPGAKLPPKVVFELEHKPPQAQRPIIEPNDHGQPLPLARFVDGLTALPVRSPGHERIEIAVDEAGRMHVLARDLNLRELPMVSQWARAHCELIAMACPQQKFDPAATPACHIFTSEPVTVADLHNCNLHLHVLAAVSVGENTAWYAAPLNVVK